MDVSERYTSLQDYTEEMSTKSNRPILTSLNPDDSLQGMSSMKNNGQCVRRQCVILLTIALLLSIAANIAFGIVLSHQKSQQPCMSKLRSLNGSSAPACEEGRTEAALEFRYNHLQSRYTAVCQQYNSLAEKCPQPGTTMKVCQPCPVSWLLHEDRCYFFGKDKMQWNESRDSCVELGGRLVILLSHKQHDFLEQEAKKLGGFDYHYWIGLNDIEKEGDWRWVDNTPVNITYWNALESQPDNHLSGGLHGEDCAVLNSHSKSWFDVPCDFQYPRICEMSAVKI